MRAAYIDGPYGQIHLRIWGTPSKAGKALICLHPAPFSGLAFQTIAPVLAASIPVIAPDYPGYGGSAPPGLNPPSIDAYADAMEAVIDAYSADTSIHVLGFHTGCLVAAELARRDKTPTASACLIDVPAFPAEQSASLVSSIGAKFAISDDISSIESIWKKTLVSRLETQSPQSAFAMFVENLRPGQDMNDAFAAAFSYPWEERFQSPTAPTCVIATQSSLLEGSRAASRIIPGATLIERLDITRSVLDAHAEPMAGEVLKWLEVTPSDF